MTQILITNGGPHPASKWAMASANQIIDVSMLDGDRLIQAEKLKFTVADILEAYHALNQEAQRQSIAEDPARLFDDYDFSRVDAAVAAVLHATETTPWATHYAQVDVIDVVHEIIVRHFASGQQIERFYYAEQHPECAQAQQFKQTESI
jgi:hypothetical protein